METILVNAWSLKPSASDFTYILFPANLVDDVQWNTCTPLTLSPAAHQLSLASSTIRGRWWRYLICLQVRERCTRFLVHHDKGFQKNPRQMFLPVDSPMLYEDIWNRGKVQHSHMYRGDAHKSQLLLTGSRDLIGPWWWHPGLLLPPLTCQGAQPLRASGHSLSRAGIQVLAQLEGEMKM